MAGTPSSPMLTVKLERNDHDFEGSSGATIRFAGYNVYDPDGRFLDVEHEQPATNVGPGLWIARLAGLSHYPAAAKSPSFHPLAMVTLHPDPTNPVDADAIEVRLSDGTRAGYVPAVLAPTVGAVLRENDTPATLITGIYSIRTKAISARLLISLERDIQVIADR
jgi:hypothetical protein